MSNINAGSLSYDNISYIRKSPYASRSGVLNSQTGLNRVHSFDGHNYVYLPDNMEEAIERSSKVQLSPGDYGFRNSGSSWENDNISSVLSDMEGAEPIDSSFQEASEVFESPAVKPNVADSVGGLGELSSLLGVVTGVTNSVANSVISQNNRDDARSVINSMPQDFSFQVTDKSNRASAVNAYESDLSSSMNVANDIRTAGVIAANMLGPEVGIPYTVADAIFGPILDSQVFKSDAADVPYNKVTTYGDFGSTINQDSNFRVSQPLIDSVNQTATNNV